MIRLIFKGILFYLTFLSFSLSSNSYEASASGMSHERLQKIAPTLNDLYLKNGKFPGFVSAVARKGKVVHYETLGFADVETGESLKRDSIQK